MISASLEILHFLQQNFHFLFSLIVYTILAVVLSRSIKKHAKIYYWVFGTICAMAFVPTLGYWTGWFRFSFYYVPVLGNIVGEFGSLAYMGHPLLVIIMYMGALSTKNKRVAGLMAIRKELSILVGFSVISHGLKRILTGVWALGYFFDHDEFMNGPHHHTSNELSTAIFTSVLVLGFVMFALFLVLWITSFGGVRKRMSFKKWKAIQRWSYALYAMLFLQAMGLKLGPYISVVAEERQEMQSSHSAPAMPAHSSGEKAIAVVDTSIAVVDTSSAVADTSSVVADTNSVVADKAALTGSKAETPAVQDSTGQQAPKAEKKENRHESRRKRLSLSDVELDPKASYLLNMMVLVGVYGSYLVLRLRKAKKDKRRKVRRTQQRA